MVMRTKGTCIAVVVTGIVIELKRALNTTVTIIDTVRMITMNTHRHPAINIILSNNNKQTLTHLI